MKGKLGAIFRGDKQVGGFFDWNEETVLNESSNKDGEAVHKFVNWQLTAPSYWLYDIASGEVVVRLYQTSAGYWEGNAFITSPMKRIFDTLIHEDIEIVGSGVLEGKE